MIFEPGVDNASTTMERMHGGHIGLKMAAILVPKWRPYVIQYGGQYFLTVSSVNPIVALNNPSS
jgi:hypothetical protein